MRNRWGGVCNLAGIAAALFGLFAPLGRAQEKQAAKPAVKAEEVIGFSEVKKGEKGTLTVQEQNLHFAYGKTSSDIAAASIEDLVTGKDSREAVGKTMSALTYAAPYGGGRVVALFRTKFDTLTIKYRDADGALHGAIFALPKGTADGIKTDLIAAGARTVAPAAPASDAAGNAAKKEKQP
jgi:hypothetical protein